MTHNPGEMARLAIFVADLDHAELLSFRSRESALRVRDQVLTVGTVGGLLTVSDDYGRELTFSVSDIRIIRLMADAP